MRRRFVQDRETGQLRELPPSFASPIHRDTFGKQEIPAMIEGAKRAREAMAKQSAVERKAALIEAVKKHERS